MKNNLIMILGVLLFAAGAFFMIESVRFTGLVILEDVDFFSGSVLGILLLIVGLFLIRTGKR